MKTDIYNLCQNTLLSNYVWVYIISIDVCLTADFFHYLPWIQCPKNVWNSVLNLVIMGASGISFKGTPIDSCLLIFMSLVVPSCVWTRLSNLLLKIKYSKCVTSRIQLWNTVTSVLLTHTLSSFSCMHLLMTLVFMSWIVLGRDPYHKELRVASGTVRNCVP